MDKELQIIRLPRKYWDIVQILSLEDKWKLLDAIFYYQDKEIELQWTCKILFELIKVDLDNLHKRASAWIKWWRPKKTNGLEKEKPKVIETIKPKVMENENLNKIKESKVKENKIKESKEKYWEYKNILLTLSQKDKLIIDYSETIFNQYVKIVDEWIQMKGYKYKDHNLVIRNWISRDKENWKIITSVSNDYEKVKAERLKRYWIKDDWF